MKFVEKPKQAANRPCPCYQRLYLILPPMK